MKHDTLVGAMQKRKWVPRDSKYTPRKQKTAYSQSCKNSQCQSTCTRCGKSPSHDRQHCPARDAICRKCSKRGHYQMVCRSTAQVSYVHLEPSEDSSVSQRSLRVG